MLSGPVDSYQLDESISKFRGVWCTFSNFILFRIDSPVSKQWRPWLDTAFCLPVCLYGLKIFLFIYFSTFSSQIYSVSILRMVTPVCTNVRAIIRCSPDLCITVTKICFGQSSPKNQNPLCPCLSLFFAFVTYYVVLRISFQIMSVFFPVSQCPPTSFDPALLFVKAVHYQCHITIIMIIVHTRGVRKIRGKIQFNFYSCFKVYRFITLNRIIIVKFSCIALLIQRSHFSTTVAKATVGSSMRGTFRLFFLKTTLFLNSWLQAIEQMLNKVLCVHRKIIVKR